MRPAKRPRPPLRGNGETGNGACAAGILVETVETVETVAPPVALLALVEIVETVETVETVEPVETVEADQEPGGDELGEAVDEGVGLAELRQRKRGEDGLRAVQTERLQRLPAGVELRLRRVGCG